MANVPLIRGAGLGESPEGGKPMGKQSGGERISDAAAGNCFIVE